ncbi:MAG TPA: hypothetical protein VM286_07775 [Candidatus Thermoplasmatota archaeon]|nr:hypothetical protein [Candidatus Thermoplasmatota archaeon]
MQAEARVRVGPCEVLLLGTIAGFVPDADRVRAALAGHKPDVLGLGVPADDLPTLRLLAEHPEKSGELPLLDEAEAHFQELLKRYGPTRVPSPDLEAAQQVAAAAGIPLEALDLDDLSHSAAYTKGMKVRHLVLASSRRKKALRSGFPDALGAYDLARRWDAALAVGPMRELEREREREMARRITGLAATSRRMLCIVPVARLAGVVAALASPA